VALVIRGDHELNAVKSQKLPGVANPLRMASAERVRRPPVRSRARIGPIGFRGTIYVDHAAAQLADFVCGANEKDVHFTGVNWGRDLPESPAPTSAMRSAGRPEPERPRHAQIARGIEVGHIFQLGQLYSEAMQATVLDEQGKAQTMFMGCYGIGVTRVVAAAIEQNHDANGIIWPEAIAPFQVVLVPINYQKSARSSPRRPAVRGIQRRRHRCAARRPRRAPGREIRRFRAHGHPASTRHRRAGLRRAKLEYRHRRDESTEIPPRIRRLHAGKPNR
jgi:prolyl-tRNA synthetase